MPNNFLTTNHMEKKVYVIYGKTPECFIFPLAVCLSKKTALNYVRKFRHNDVSVFCSARSSIDGIFII